jgi:hypothetical protein
MTVAELMTELAGMPPDAEIWVPFVADDYPDFTSAYEATIGWEIIGRMTKQPTTLTVVHIR